MCNTSMYKESNELYQERYELVLERIEQMAKGVDLEGEYAPYFKEVASLLLEMSKVKCCGISLEELKAQNDRLFGLVAKARYEESYLNPAYAVSQLGEEYGAILSAIFERIFANIKPGFAGDIKYVCIYAELIVELYYYFTSDELSVESVKSCIYSFMHDYAEVFDEDRIGARVNPAFDHATKILMEADLDSDDYLYGYGLNVTENETLSRAHLATFSDEEIQSMADTYTEGYRLGFITCNKDLSIKSTVEIIYPIGFERMVRVAADNFKKLGLTPVCSPFSTSPNKQFEFDHKEDGALWLDKAYVEYRLECIRNAYEKNKDIAAQMGGPAVVEIFGEEPFAPVSKKENPSFSQEQQQLMAYFRAESGRITNKYIKGEERSFTIIAYPLPAIGPKYAEIFTETVKINTLDYMLYRDMQQKIIDILDTADKVHIVGANGNKTDLYVKVCPLANPEKETAFENCVADVNIPVGEVFTSPTLEGTNGKLHVTQVYLNELNYLDLEIDFTEGMISEYTCGNFEDEAENKKYIADNLLFHHKSLPMGEFAIGTNTTAYRVAREYDIAAKLPILIAEKTGPHFAIGDTCFSYDEDNMTYNPDGKAIVARDNSVSILRKTDISKAYFNCHTDITIPYDELGAITVIGYDGSETDIIRDGRFVVPGTEELNKPLDEMK